MAYTRLFLVSLALASLFFVSVYCDVAVAGNSGLSSNNAQPAQVFVANGNSQPQPTVAVAQQPLATAAVAAQPVQTLPVATAAALPAQTAALPQATTTGANGDLILASGVKSAYLLPASLITGLALITVM